MKLAAAVSSLSCTETVEEELTLQLNTSFLRDNLVTFRQNSTSIRAHVRKLDLFDAVRCVHENYNLLLNYYY